MTKEQVETLVSRGAKLLDEKMPGWYNRVNTKTLDLRDNYKCVLGQLYGDLTKSFPEVRLGLLTRTWMYNGFWWENTGIGMVQMAKAAWKKEIKDRREKSGLLFSDGA